LLLALLSDVHSNLEALQACLKHAREAGAERYAFLGDLVGYGADPGPVIEVVQRYAAEGAVVVQGNHDAAVARYNGPLSEGAQDAIFWTRTALPAPAQRWLQSLPLCVREGPLCFVHASAAEPDRWEYVDSPAAARRSAEEAGVPWTFSGHVHRQILFFEALPGKMTSFYPVAGSAVPVRSNRRWVAIVGSVGQPREPNPAAAYALFDDGREVLTYQRVPYDHLEAARKIRAAGLPDTLTWTRRR
jgi:diadenosine tetraphosphatase ApaH/serine/threonine PP2A family protein phosphatase